MRALVLLGTVLFAVATIPAPAQARDGGAIAAGIIGGLALGGLAAAAAGPHYGYSAYGYRPYAHRPRYYRATSNCWAERRRTRDDYGNAYFRRVRVCG